MCRVSCATVNLKLCEGVCSVKTEALRERQPCGGQTSNHFALWGERTNWFVTVLWCLSQPKWSPIFCKLLSVQVPVWWLAFMMPNPNFIIQSQIPSRKGKSAELSSSSFRSPISCYQRLSLKKQSFFFFFLTSLLF